MKLKVFDPSNTVVGGHNVLPSISMNTKTGVIRLSAGFSYEVDIKAGDEVVLAQDEENPSNWYLKLQKGGFKLRKSSSSVKNPSVCFSSKDLSHRMVRSSAEPNALNQTVQMNLSTEPEIIEGVAHYAIATKTAKTVRS